MLITGLGSAFFLRNIGNDVVADCVEAFVDQCLEDDPGLFIDAPPCRDNAKVMQKDMMNMSLKQFGDAIYVGRIFKNKGELRKALCVYSLKRLYTYKILKSDRKKVLAICDDENCRWRIYTICHLGSGNFEIRTATLNHTCDAGSRSQRGTKATTTLLGELLQAKYAHGKKGPRACDLPELVLGELKVTITYMKAWHAKEVAMRIARGNEEDSYNFLATYLHLLETTNPWTISKIYTTLTSDGKRRFKYLFVAFGASVAGYKFLRKVVTIDGTATKGKYKSCLVAASGQDENYQIFPLAFGVVDSENSASWTCFFTELKKVVPEEDELVFVSDRHAAINTGFKAVYQLASHANCTIHLVRNVQHKFKCEGLYALTSNASRAYTVGDFRYWFEEIHRRNPRCSNYLIEIPKAQWALAHFQKNRYNIMSSNISEALNSALQKAMSFPIVTIVEFIRTMLMRWFCERREEARKTKTRSTPEIEDILIEHLKDAIDCAVIASTD